MLLYTLHVRSKVQLQGHFQVLSRACFQGSSQFQSMLPTHSTRLDASDVVGKRFPRLQTHAIEWVRDRVRVIATLNCTQCHIPSLLGSSLQCTISRGNTLPNTCNYMLQCILLHTQSRVLQRCMWHAQGCVRQVAGGRMHVAGGRWLEVGGIWCLKS